jgi:protein-arginine kinase activator protein McsA
MEHSVNANSSIRSCKLCGENLPKIDCPKTPSGYVGKVDDNGKRWHGNVCSKCLPQHRKTQYRPNKTKESLTCNGCGNTFMTNKSNKTGTCSNKCYMRVTRKNTVKSTNRDSDLHVSKLNHNPLKDT